MTESKTTGNRSVVVRIVMVLAVAFTAWHIFATFLWIAPASGLRQVIPGDALTRYMIPMHGQSWSVFAPEPINGDYRIQVRAVVTENGTTRTTDWVDATAAEITMLTHNLAPPRAGIQSIELASRFKGAWDALSAEQQEIVSLGYYNGSDWRDRLGVALEATGDAAEAGAYLDIERVVTAYSTQVAYAMWGEGVEQVQFVISRQNVIPFAQRNDPDAERPAVQPAPTGWRGTLVEPGQSQENFARIFRTAVAESGQ
ncbi:DUF5819 family protein [Occultella gossypii]|uniref:Uncharacterized protein n=1 Tax=Occultella gossypii TaxID=2800820 RepID=A0ABS7SIQ7_9MICO|nr:DUF5819 family protein [Occultella gossypii]MBZ2199749.1 hypothetical protein [Occultella gossypii]